jgi:hypothetical protein
VVEWSGVQLGHAVPLLELVRFGGGP